MKYIFLLFFCLVTSIYSCEKPTNHDLLQHFIDEANYGEVFRLCEYHLENPQNNFIYEALALLQKRDRALIPLVKSAWQKYGTHLVEQSEKQFQPRSECMSEVEYNAYINKETLKAFKSWIEAQQ